jgi:hypothetical protein
MFKQVFIERVRRLPQDDSYSQVIFLEKVKKFCKTTLKPTAEQCTIVSHGDNRGAQAEKVISPGGAPESHAPTNSFKNTFQRTALQA